MFETAETMLHLLGSGLSAACIMSARADICLSPNMSLSIEKTRSAAAEFGVKEPSAGKAKFHEISLKSAVKNMKYTS